MRCGGTFLNSNSAIRGVGRRIQAYRVVWLSGCCLLACLLACVWLGLVAVKSLAVGTVDIEPHSKIMDVSPLGEETHIGYPNSFLRIEGLRTYA
jgi:hypothetical protein